RLADNPQLAGIKHLNRLDQVLAARELSPGTEGLLQDVAGQVVEGLSGNLFVKTAAGWRTPPLTRAGVRGVMRELLLDEIFPVLGIPVVEHEVAVEEMFAAEALFLCNAVRGIEPVAWLEPANRLLEIAPVRVIARELERRWSCFASC
ncbi:MAG: aminotransferase class IV, partial [Pseudomonadales bacterium]|nr:aminotransferase class IV [Pseudomonadales bacterium]